MKLNWLQEKIDSIPESTRQMVRMRNSYEEKIEALNKIIEAQATYIDALRDVIAPLKIFAAHFHYLHKEEDLSFLEESKKEWKEAKEKYKGYLNKPLFG